MSPGQAPLTTLPNLYLFGLPGVGKTFCGECLERDLGYSFHDGDQWLPEDLRESLKRGHGFTEEQRDRYVAEIARCIQVAKDMEQQEALRCGRPARPLAVAQATFKRRHRQQIGARHPEFTFVWIQANEEARLQRLAQRGSGVDAQLGRKMKLDFEAPGFEEKHLVFYNDQDEIEATLSGIEGLLQDVDTAKSRLAMLHRQLEGKLHKAEDLASKKQQAKELAKLAANAKARSNAEATPEAEPTPQATPQAPAPVLEPPAPGKGVWEKVRLPLRFTSREEPKSYVISATVPGLDLEDLKLELGDASTTLLVEGFRIPSKKESALMRKRIAQKIRQVAQTSPEKFAMLVKALPEVTEDAYLELGQGEFGRFAETFRLPKDVDVENIEASYTDGVLRIVLPKIQIQPQSDGWSFPTGHPARLRRAPQGHPGLGRGAAGPWGGSLFGGHDDFFRW